MGNFINELKGYQTIPRNLIFDNSLPDRARFLYCYMAAKPDDWDFFLEPMARELQLSVETVRKYLQCLIDAGWIEKGEQSNEHGQFGAVTYTLKADNNRAIIFPSRKKTATEKTRDGKITPQTDKDNIKDKDNINLSHHNAREERNYLEEEKQTLMSDRPWQEVVCMNMKMTIAELERHITEFFEVCACSGVDMHNNAKDLKQHFFNWLKINKNGNNKRGNQQKSALQVVHEYGEELARKVLTGEYQDSHPAGSPFPD